MKTVENFESEIASEANSEALSNAILRGGEGFVIPMVQESEGPFYFGIDCRSELETKLGKFPKVLLRLEMVALEIMYARLGVFHRSGRLKR